jgi:hypothetical protein
MPRDVIPAVLLPFQTDFSIDERSYRSDGGQLRPEMVVVHFETIATATTPADLLQLPELSGGLG